MDLHIVILFLGWFFTILGILNKDVNTIGIGFIFFTLQVLYREQELRKDSK